MSRNIEIKARLHDLATFRKRVVELPASGPELLLQRDTFYSVLQGRLKLRDFGDGTSELIYYQRPDKAGPKTSKYARTPIADATSMRQLLGQILETKAVVTKQREVFLTCVTLGPSEKYHRRPRLCCEMTAANLPTALQARSAFRLLIAAPGRKSGHRRDAYDTLNSATCVPVRPSEKFALPK
jgi:hypothetical protein